MLTSLYVNSTCDSDIRLLFPRGFRFNTAFFPLRVFPTTSHSRQTTSTY